MLKKRYVLTFNGAKFAYETITLFGGDSANITLRHGRCKGYGHSLILKRNKAKLKRVRVKVRGGQRRSPLCISSLAAE